MVLWVLYKSWGSPLETTTFKIAVVSLSIGGILKCLQKSWALKGASFHSLANSCGPAQRTASREEELEEYIVEARTFVLSDEYHSNNPPTEYMSGMLFVDLAYPYRDRLNNLKAFCRDSVYVYWKVKRRLTNIFEALYTSEKMTDYEEFSSRWTLSKYQGFGRKLICYRGASFFKTYYNPVLFVRLVYTI